MLAHS